MLGLIGMFGGLILLIVLTMRGMNLLIAAPLTALFVAVLNGLPLFPQLAGEGAANYLTNYMDGFTGFIASWYLMFLTGAIFGKVMEDTGAADSANDGEQRAAAAVAKALGIAHELVPARDVPMDGALVYSAERDSEAVEWLARRFNYDLHYEDETPGQVEAAIALRRSRKEADHHRDRQHAERNEQPPQQHMIEPFREPRIARMNHPDGAR